MPSIRSACRSAILAIGLATGAAAFSQSALSPISPTSLTPAADSAPIDAIPAPPPMHKAQVGYQMGQLTVIAENSSLDEILRDISRQTGMKITGSVLDQHVYGTYGPAAPAQVLSTLLDGTSNMILRETRANEPAELILTPLQGQSAQPDLNMQGRAAPSSPYNPVQPAVTPYQSTPQQGYTPQPPSPRPAYVTQPQAAYPANSIAPAPGTVQQAIPPANPSSPNGVATPQQIYEQLQRLQQQKAQPPAGSQ